MIEGDYNMIRKAADMKSEMRTNMKGGNGQIQMIHLLEKDEFGGKGRLYNKIIIKPKMSIGYHEHNGEFEAYYIVKGEAMFDDNGVKSTLSKGDLTVTGGGKGHSIENIGNEDLEIIALILYE